MNVTALFAAIMQLCFLKKTSPDQLEIVNLLLEHDANPDAEIFQRDFTEGSETRISIRDYCTSYLANPAAIDNHTAQVLTTIINAPGLSSAPRLG